jgi:hypothetical protein
MSRKMFGFCLVQCAPIDRYDFSVRAMKLLVNNYEKITHDKLAAACRAESARVCPKVRVKDALPIERSGVSGEHFRYALQSHFDFVVTDKDSNVLFAVEFDGPLHDSLDAERRDRIKNELYDRFSLPLLRVNANHLQRRFRQWDLLSYFVETWFRTAPEGGTDSAAPPGLFASLVN